MARLADTNVLVYRFDPRYPEKQEIATQLLRQSQAERDIVLPHQALIEFVAAVTRPRGDPEGEPLLHREEALQVVREFVRLFPVLYPDEEVLTTALTGTALYQLSWFDAHLWAYAEVHGLPEILSEDFEHGRHYGAVRVVDPFLSAAGSVSELPAMYEATGSSAGQRAGRLATGPGAVRGRASDVRE